MSSAWKGRRSGHSASAGSATATACSAADVTSAATSAAATATGTAAAATAGIVASACGVRLLGGSFSLASPDASASSRVSTRFCCCTSDAIERSSPALEAEGRLVVAIWSCWRSTREMKTTHSSNAPPKSSWCSLIRLRPAMRVKPATVRWQKRPVGDISSMLFPLLLLNPDRSDKQKIDARVPLCS